MTMLPIGGLVSSAAGVPLSQSAGETERTQKESQSQSRQIDVSQRAERAAGIGQTEEDQESSERDADGRRLWEAPTEQNKNVAQDDAPVDAARQSKDSTGQSGTRLDLTG
jgi:hypothetical protein